MPAWTALASADFRRQRIFTASSHDEQYSLQIHPRDPLAFLVRLRFPDRRRVLPITIADELFCLFLTSTSEFRVVHVQHLPSWKGHICRAIVLVEGLDS